MYISFELSENNKRRVNYDRLVDGVALSENFGGILARPNVPSVGSGRAAVFSKLL